MDYKDTLFMGKTDFEMRGNLNTKEPNIQKKWYAMHLYEKVLKKNENKREYTLHDGPPYANGDIHLGHSLNKILKDFVVRYKNMNGFKSVYIPGWDTHGLPIENQLQKSGVKRKEMSIADFRKLCEEYAYKQVERQKAGFLRLGVLGDYDHPYITLQHDFEKDQILIFAKMAEKGLIYKGLKPVYWSYSSESALAEAEIEYQDKEDFSIYFKLPIVGQKDLEDAAFLVWTTTPWTLPANLAVCAGPSIDYVLADTAKGKLIFGLELKDRLTELLELGEVTILKKYKGTDLEGLTYKHPLYDRISPCILGDYVSTSDGSGLVHIAPGHGEDDYMVGKAYGLDILCPVDYRGYMTKEAGQYEGLFYQECNTKVMEDMDACGCLLKTVKIVHSYPHDWRTHKPVIFRATPQWFASIDPIKEEILKAISDTNWNPKWGEIRLANMIKDRHDWCISRQRAWGVPIPIFYAENGEPVLDQKVFAHIADLFGTYGSNIWFEKEAKDLLPKGFTHPGSPNGLFTKEKDIMDVWFDSGSSYMLLNRRGLSYPADLYLEGSDQYRGWFNASLITGVATTGKAPFKTVVSHGFTLDGEGRKMSKSLGNTVDPIKTCNEYGADILRLWVASIEYRADMPLSKDILKQVSESYRKIRNTLRFLMANTSDFNPKDALSYEELTNVDKYMHIKLQRFIKEIKNHYDNFDFGEVYRATNTYIANTLSAFYLDFTKDILYIESPLSKKRLSCQTVFYEILEALLKLLSPIIPHTMSEAYDLLPYKAEEDIYLTDMPMEVEVDEQLEADFDSFMKYRDEILKALEEARASKVIGKSFNAKLTITLDSKAKKLFTDLNSDLAQLLIVSQLELKDGDTFNVLVEKALGETCERCWMIVPSINSNGLCPRCQRIIEHK
ncbi:MAG: isoleucine--tRNA ligase [Acholeplasmatales bacterium]|jgi:isoleucyl-tRNA synthetase|nr:isoleucine--tRNA ligase [Acholeplasmatales bacterium]